MKKAMILFAFVMMVSAMAIYAEPVSNAQLGHPNLIKAQQLLDNAVQKIEQAQKANEFDMAGHAARAKDLIGQASGELKLAAVAATENKGPNPSPNVKDSEVENKTVNNISEARHHNLAIAQDNIDKAYQRVIDAQKANEFDLGGHAAKAKDLLEDASKELKLAAAEASDHKK
jgi:hypothetical protein